jgi:hypothetical protein
MADKYFTQIKDELIRSTKLTPHEKAVLFVLLSYGSCKEIYVNQNKIAEQANLSRISVVRAISALRKKKLIETEMKPDRSTLVYTLDDNVVVSQSNNVVVSESNKGCITEQQGVVSESDTRDRRVSNKRLDIKEKEIIKKKKARDDTLAIRMIEIFNEVNGKNHSVNNETHLLNCHQIIKALAKMGFRGEDAVLEKVRYVCENKKRHEETSDYWKNNKITTVFRKSKFLAYMEEEKHGELRTASSEAFLKRVYGRDYCD